MTMRTGTENNTQNTIDIKGHIWHTKKAVLQHAVTSCNTSKTLEKSS